MEITKASQTGVVFLKYQRSKATIRAKGKTKRLTWGGRVYRGRGDVLIIRWGGSKSYSGSIHFIRAHEIIPEVCSQLMSPFCWW